MSQILSDVAVDSAVNAITALLDNGYLRIYAGIQPNSPNEKADSQLLAELRFSKKAFGVSSKGKAAATEMIADPAAKATGVAIWFRAFMADGKTAVIDGSVGVGDSNLNLNSRVIQLGARVALNSFVYSQEA